MTDSRRSRWNTRTFSFCWSGPRRFNSFSCSFVKLTSRGWEYSSVKIGSPFTLTPMTILGKEVFGGRVRPGGGPSSGGPDSDGPDKSGGPLGKAGASAEGGFAGLSSAACDRTWRGVSRSEASGSLPIKAARVESPAKHPVSMKGNAKQPGRTQRRQLRQALSIVPPTI